MTSYVYLSSDAPLQTSKISDNRKQKIKSLIYFKSDSIDTLVFKDYFDSKSRNNLSCSDHFSDAVHQVFSVTVDFPNQTHKASEQRNKIVLYDLFHYLVNHFDNTSATYVEILFCLKGSENEPLFQEKLVTYEWLAVDDLYYAERKFMRIDTQMTEFIFRRNIA